MRLFTLIVSRLERGASPIAALGGVAVVVTLAVSISR